MKLHIVNQNNFLGIPIFLNGFCGRNALIFDRKNVLEMLLKAALARLSGKLSKAVDSLCFAHFFNNECCGSLPVLNVPSSISIEHYFSLPTAFPEQPQGRYGGRPSPGCLVQSEWRNFTARQGAESGLS